MKKYLRPLFIATFKSREEEGCIPTGMVKLGIHGGSPRNELPDIETLA